MASLVLTGDTSGQVTIAAPAVAGTNTATLPAATGTVVVLATPQSMVRLITANGFGSTNTAIRRFTTTLTNQGSDITYADSATLGATFTINTTGVYSIIYFDNFTVAPWMGISLNSTQLTTSINSITSSDALSCIYNGVANGNSTASWIGYLVSGSVVRAHSTVGTSTGTGAPAQFTITRIT